MNITKVLAIAALSLATSTSALAWGPREQGMLVGAGALLLGQHIYNHHDRGYQAPAAPVYYVQPQPVYVAPPPVIYTPPQPAYMDVCQFSGQRVRVYDSYGNVMGLRYCQ